MSMTLTNDALSRALARAMAGACAATLGGTASVAEGQAASGPGWVVTVPFSGAAAGRMLAWIDAASAAACARRALSVETDPADDAIAQVLATIAGKAAGAVETTPEGAGLMAGDPQATKAPSTDMSQAFSVVFDDGLTIGCRVSVEMAAASAPTLAPGVSDSRLEAVLEVDLPLVVRFGRTVMPLRSVAELSPGSVVDMGRTPDEPVELLVGERLVARGEVVIVGGNYGVRITELTNGRRSTDLEARL